MTPEQFSIMLPFFNTNTGARLSQEEELYFNHIMYLLKRLRPSGCWVKFLSTLGAVVGFYIGAFIGSVTSVIIGVLMGSTCGWVFATWDHDQMLSTLEGKSEEEKVRIVALVQGVVGGSRDFYKLEHFINDGGNRKLLKALKENINPRIRYRLSYLIQM